MRRILAVGCAGLLAFTIVTQSASAADLGMPLKAPPVVEAPPPVCDALCLAALAALVAGGIVGGLCLGQVICHHHGPTPPPTNGGNNKNDALLHMPAGVTA
jgi:hypothetical protein